jgi:hypothetical protein
MLEAARPATRVCWRVMAANNRALGRSRSVYPSLVTCRAAAVILQRRIDDVNAVPVLDESVGHWSWTIALDATEVAVCVHPFQRRIDCLRALRLFVEAVRASDPSAAELRYFGPSSLRGYDLGVEVTP